MFWSNMNNTRLAELRSDFSRIWTEIQLIKTTQSQILTKEIHIMATLDQVLADEQAEAAAIAAVASAIADLKAQLAAAIAAASQPISPDLQAKIDEIFTAAEANKAALGALEPPPVVPPAA
jgi:TolA-binding protein